MNLLFHVVVPAGASPRGAPWLAVTATELADLVERLRARGLAPASLADYLGPAPPGPGAFTVSFDDAHPGVLELAAPVLAELGVPATVFVPTAHVGETDRVMGWPEVRALAALPGWVVGSHGAAHERMGWRLYLEGPAEHLARLGESARRSRAALAERLGASRAPALFAYPFGEAPALARRAVRDAGYAAAVTVAPSADWDGDLLGIPRVDGVPLARPALASPAGAPTPGISVVVPACDRVALLREVVRRLATQSYPADRHEVIVVDDGSRADLRAALAPWIDAGGGRVRVVALGGADATFRAGQARQAGAEAARFEIVAFLDADVAVDADFLWHLAYAHGLDPAAVVLGYLSGYNLHDLGHVHRVEEIAAADRLTGDALPVIPDRSREPSLRECLDDVDALAEPWRLAYTGNLSVSRALLARAGGFAADFSGWGFEDVDLGVRLHDAGARWVFSRWVLGYHMAGPLTHGEDPVRNPFRDPEPGSERFAGVLRNLDALERRHRGHAGVAAFCAQVRADVEEICAPPDTVGVEVGADDAIDWPFAPASRLRRARPGGLPLEEVLERLAYAEKLGARAAYLLGGDVALRPELSEILEAARARGLRDVTIETTAIPLARPGAARRLARQGLLSAAVVEVLVGAGHPARQAAVARGVAALREAGVRLSARLVVGTGDPGALGRALDWVRELGLPISSVVALDPDIAARAREILGVEVERP
jgi:peptidoglycan/xylan/chitin deacetylase (PgdA/CDA1 family)/GT2 family glycosyltransferase